MKKERPSGHEEDVPAASKYSLALLPFALSFGCSSTPPTEAPATGGTPSSAGGGGSGGSLGGSSSGGSMTPVGTAGSAGTAVSGGAGGSAGNGSAGASAGSGGGGAGGMASSGITCAPTADGNGVHDQPGPYGAPPEATVKANVPVGMLTDLTPITSSIYAGHVFGYRIYVPAQYKPEKRAAFMMVQDGPSHYLGKNSDAKFFANKVMDNLIAEGTVPVTIGLFVDPCMQTCEDQRVTIYDDATDKYARFVTEELLPSVIAGKYSIVQDPEAWLTVGYSAGAAQGFTVIWNKPVFHKFIGHNTSFPAAKDHGVDYAALVPNTPNKGFRVSLVSGTMDLSDARGNWLEASKQMEMVLTAKGYPTRLMTGTGGHYPPDQSAMDFPNALRWMWQGCKLSDY